MKDTFSYPFAKHGVIGLTRALALQYADRGIIANAISPGYIDIPINEWYFGLQPDPVAYRRKTEARQSVGRIGNPDDVAGAALFLASDDARFVTCANLVVDGSVIIRFVDLSSLRAHLKPFYSEVKPKFVSRSDPAAQWTGALKDHASS